MSNMWLNALSVTLLSLYLSQLCQGVPLENKDISMMTKRSLYPYDDENPWRDYWADQNDVIDYPFVIDEQPQDNYEDAFIRKHLGYDVRNRVPEDFRIPYSIWNPLTHMTVPGLVKKDLFNNGRSSPSRGRNPYRGGEGTRGSFRPYNKCKRGKSGLGTWLYGC
ncbi:uncharacterized protein LOC144451569 [Glandiceps talaboti]